MKKSVVFAALMMSVTGSILYGLWAARPVAEVCVAQRGTAISAVYGTVKVVATMSLNVRARNSGIIRFSDAIAKTGLAGIEVKQSDVLATIVNEDLNREIAKGGCPDSRLREATRSG